eukprot:SAG31_NODE_3324_length_4411_cov_1.686456_1_plen_94_part_00
METCSSQAEIRHMHIDLVKMRARNRAHAQVEQECGHGHGDEPGEDDTLQNRFSAHLAGFRQTADLAGRHADASNALKETTGESRQRAATNIQR